MRTTKELLQVLLDNIDKLKTGLCLLASDLENERAITPMEWDTIHEHIANGLQICVRCVSALAWENGANVLLYVRFAVRWN